MHLVRHERGFSKTETRFPTKATLLGRNLPEPEYGEAIGRNAMLSLNDAERRKLAEIVVVRCFRGLPPGQIESPRSLAAVRRESPAKREEPMPHRVLVVDDEANILLSLEFLMKKAGYDVCTARDGEEALAEMRKARPDLVLLDVMMPKRNGFDVCEMIRANPEWKNVRVIMLTAKGRDVEREKGLAVGANDYITKPFSTREVVERVSEWLDGAGH